MISETQRQGAASRHETIFLSQTSNATRKDSHDAKIQANFNGAGEADGFSFQHLRSDIFETSHDSINSISLDAADQKL
jgi:hypothetical protein